MIGESFGNYRALSQLGEGGMGAVYLAEHGGLGKRVAIKILLPRYSQDEEMVQRFFNEARAASMIKHPGIVDIYDFGTHTNGAAYIVMELLSGESLASRLARGPLPETTIIELTKQLAMALGAAHEHGIVHRDLKPDNLYLVPDPLIGGGVRLKILDFGISKLGDKVETKNVQTVTGQLMGTPLYMSPEQCRSAKFVDQRSDLYSVGCILFQLASGRPPFNGDGLGELIVAHMTEPWTPLATVAPVSPKFSAIVDKLLAKKADQRYQTAAELVADLDPSAPMPIATPSQPHVAIVAPQPIASQTTLRSMSGEVASPAKRPSGLGVLVVGGALILAAAGGWWSTRSMPAPAKEPSVSALPIVAAPVVLDMSPTIAAVAVAAPPAPLATAKPPATSSPTDKRRIKTTRSSSTPATSPTPSAPEAPKPTPQPIKNNVLDPFGK